MDHTAKPFVPKHRQHVAPRTTQTQPMTPPLGPGPQPPSASGNPSFGGGGYGGPGPQSYGPPPHHHHHHHHHHHQPHHHHHHHQAPPPPGSYRGGHGGPPNLYPPSRGGAMSPPSGAMYQPPAPPGGGPRGAVPAPHHSDPARPPPYGPSGYAAAVAVGGGAPDMANASKLRAGASEFVPPGGKSQSPPTAKGVEKEVEPESEKPPESPTKLCAKASPYTPTRRSPPSSGFPSTVAPTSASSPSAKPGSANDSFNTTSRKGSVAPVSAAETSTLGKSGASTASFPNADSPAPMTPVTPTSPMFLSAADTFKYSTLPVPESPEAPKEPGQLKLNGAWNLFVDSHPIALGTSPVTPAGGGAPADFNPTLLKAVADIETFWRVWRSMKVPSLQTPSFTYYFFRRTIDPTWEDPRNAAGGRITVPLWDRDKNESSEKRMIDDAWWVTTMALVGESLPQAASVNGAVLKLRQRSVLLELWPSTSKQSELAEIANAFKDALRMAMHEKAPSTLEFFPHQPEKTPQSPAAPRPSRGKAKPNRREPLFRL